MSKRNVAMVTGAAGGIGTAVCERLIGDGWRVAALDLAVDGLHRLRDSHGGVLECFALDQTEEAQVQATVLRVEQEMGPIHGLANVLGWSESTRFDQETSDYWSKVIAINFSALLYVVQPVLRAMAARKHGKMVFVASDAARVGTAGQAVYAGTKGAVIAFAKSLARENARHGITVNCVSPGPTETPLFLNERTKHPEMVDRMLKTIPLRRPALPAEQAAAVSFLLSSNADYITGQTLSVSGGLTML